MLTRRSSDTVLHWPARIDGLRVDCVESVAGDAVAGERAGLGSQGVWLVPRLVGMGRLDWSVNS